MTPEQIRSSIDWYRRVGDGSIRVFYSNGRDPEVGRVTHLTATGFRFKTAAFPAGHRVLFENVEAAESGCFA